MRYVQWLVLAAATAALAACAQSAGPQSSSPSSRLTPEQMHRLLVKACKQSSSFQCLENPFTVKVRRENTSEFERYFAPPVPVIQHAAITVFAGLTLNIEARPGANGRLTHLHLVGKAAHPESTLVVTLEQVTTGQGQNYMKLDVHNPFPEALVYKVAINPLRVDGFRAVDACPAGAGTTSYETWPEPLFKVRLTDLRLVASKGKAPAC